MALPTSGPLSFSMIGAELGAGTPFSLRNMSSNAGFGTPDRVSDFYGYGPGGGLIPFFISDEVNDVLKVCNFNQGSCIPVWHNGSGALPVIGDTVYTDASGNLPLEGFFGGYFDMSDIECATPFSWFFINSKQPGVVQDIGFCFY